MPPRASLPCPDLTRGHKTAFEENHQRGRRGGWLVRHSTMVSRIQLRTWFLRLILGLLAATAAACREGPADEPRPAELGASYPSAEKGEATYRPVLDSLVADHLEAPDSSAPRPRSYTYWIETPEAREPAILRRTDFGVSIRKENLGGESLRGRYGLVSEAAAHEHTAATFRIRLSSSLQEPGQILLEDTIAASSTLVRELTYDFADSDLDSGYLSLEVEYQTRKRGSLTAAWIDPILIGERPVVGEPPPHPWNVLLITADTTRQDVLSCYGGPARTTALERLAADGVTFTNAFSVAFGTSPSHASLLTASHPASHGVYDNQTVLGSENTTLQELLRDRGYSTAAFISARPLVRSLGFSQGFDFFDDVLIRDPWSQLGKYSSFERRADATAASLLHWLSHYEMEPFFAWIHFFDPHQPYAPPVPAAADQGESRETLINRYFRAEDGELKYLRGTDLPPGPPGLIHDIDELARAQYRQEIEYMDAQIGRILTVLEDRDLYQRTLIVFIADHGEHFLERGRDMAYRHGTLFKEVSHLPLIIKLPSSEHGGTTMAALVGNLDIAPTVIDVLGLAAPEGWTGRSFLPVLGAESGRRFRPYLVLEGSGEQEIAVRTADWLYRQLLDPSHVNAKMIHRLGYDPRETAEVYDLRSDPSELTKTPLHDCPEISQLRSIVANFLTYKEPGKAQQSVTDAEHLEALRALGYLE